ncbi:DUF1127 domain-containing protein [Pseudaminobacter salicylatoxidans]|uniref:DUF1127 domain-containing protein n=1 Tax=Pseudaminobacter salicylatoxidans TaxID=93369 RepID=UPI0003129C24|nr:DUF1127 domain-containing protein [Pseudaminobacter salicylatoxidans]
MKTFEHASQTMQLAVRPAFAARAMNTLSRMFRVWQNRRDFSRLHEMTDWELKDIGLVRSDLRCASDIAFGADPTIQLSSMVRDRVETVQHIARRGS